MDIVWSVFKYVLIIGSLAFVLIAPVIWNMRRLQEAARDPEIEAEYLRAGCDVTTSLANSRQVISGVLHGMRFALTVGTGSRSALQSTSVSIPSVLGGSFVAAREESRAPSGGDLIESMFPDARAREAVREVFLLGFNTVTLNGGSLSAFRAGKAEILHPDALRVLVEHLSVIGATTGVRVAPTLLAPSRSTNRICLASIALVPAGMLLLALGSVHGGAALQGAWTGIAVVYFALAALAVFLLRRRPLARMETGFVVFMGLPGLFLGGMGVAMIAGS